MLHQIKAHQGKSAAFSFLFTTVLEKSLAALVLDIPESYIDELENLNEKEGKSAFAYNPHRDANINNTPKNVNMESMKFNESVSKGDEASTIEDSIRVHTSVLDDLLNLTGEMVLFRNQLLQTVGMHKTDIQGLDSVMQNAGYIVAQMQEKVMEARLQPIATVFSRFPRVVRELSRRLEKEVELKMEGMDVVKTNVEKMGGFIEVETMYGKGTAFTLTLPLTVAIIPSLILGLQGQKYAIQQINIQEIVHIKPEDGTKRIEYIKNAVILRLRDELLPAAYLSDALGLERENHDEV